MTTHCGHSPDDIMTTGRTSWCGRCEEIAKMDDTKHLIRATMNEAYWNAARAVCPYCIQGNIPTKNPHTAGWWEHKMPHLDHATDCACGAIHALIENLNEVKP